MASAAAAVRAAASAELVLLAGDEGLTALSAISAAHPSLPRITIVGPGRRRRRRERLVDAIRGALVHHRPPPRDFETLTRDRLTGALAWHYFRLRLAEELDRAGRYTRALSLLLVDLDDLRGLNDRLGRAAGDFALATVASSLIARRALGRLRRTLGGRRLRAARCPRPPSAPPTAWPSACAPIWPRAACPRRPSCCTRAARLRVTMSCGVASLYKDGAAHAGTLVARADHALWRAKLGGRNRSIVD